MADIDRITLVILKEDGSREKFPLRTWVGVPRKTELVWLGDEPYVVVVAAAADEAARLEHGLVLLLSLGMPALAAALALGRWLLTGAMFRPVRDMIEQAESAPVIPGKNN